MSPWTVCSYYWEVEASNTHFVKKRKSALVSAGSVTNNLNCGWLRRVIAWTCLRDSVAMRGVSQESKLEAADRDNIIKCKSALVSGASLASNTNCWRLQRVFVCSWVFDFLAMGGVFARIRIEANNQHIHLLRNCALVSVVFWASLLTVQGFGLVLILPVMTYAAPWPR